MTKDKTNKDFLEQLSSTEAGQVMLHAMERLPDGIGIFGPNFEVLYANKQSTKRFPTTYRALKEGKSMQEAGIECTRVILNGRDEETIQQASKSVYDATLEGRPIMTKTEDGRYVQLTYKTLENGNRVAISVDITEQREREKELKVARKQADAASASKSSFLANTSHEIRTPLNAILGMAQVLSKYDLPEEAHDHISSILDAGKTLTALLNDVLDLSKIEAGKLEISPVDADITHAMRRILRLWRPRAEEKGLDISLSIDAEMPSTLNFDPTRIRQCVSNLVSNAIKFTEQGTIDIMVRSKRTVEGDYKVSLSVRDTGIGIDAETQEKLCQPFVQADGSTSRKFGGTGLGLAITRKLAEQMGGGLTIQSFPGQGSTFTISFLADAAKTDRVQMTTEVNVAEENASKFSGLRVLIVDDIPINRQVATLFLRPLGCQTVEAENGVVALEKLRTEKFDIVLLDVHMPVMDGTTTIREIRNSSEPWNDVKVVALTADAMSGDRERYLRMGMNGYISKPISESEMTTEMLRVLNARPVDVDEAKSA